MYMGNDQRKLLCICGNGKIQRMHLSESEISDRKILEIDFIFDQLDFCFKNERNKKCAPSYT